MRHKNYRSIGINNFEIVKQEDKKFDIIIVLGNDYENN